MPKSIKKQSVKFETAFVKAFKECKSDDTRDAMIWQAIKIAVAEGIRARMGNWIEYYENFKEQFGEGTEGYEDCIAIQQGYQVGMNAGIEIGRGRK